MSTFSTPAIYSALRARALGFTALSNATLATLLSNRFYFIQPPDNAGYPHAVMNVLDRSKSGEYNGQREEWLVEFQFVGRPRAQLAAIEAIADVFDEAFWSWAEASSGLIFSRGERARSTLPPFDLPADREVCIVRTVHRFIIWPRFLTQYSVPS